MMLVAVRVIKNIWPICLGKCTVILLNFYIHIYF